MLLCDEHHCHPLFIMQDYNLASGNGLTMIQIDYNGYLDGQTVWAKTFINLAKAEKGQKSREFADLATRALRRTVRIQRHFTQVSF